MIDINEIAALLPPECIFAGKLTALDRTDSTSTRLRLLAEGGAPEGSALLAEVQTGGRGTHGRSFWSAEGGLYLSVLLRPRGTMADLLTLTGRAGAAVCRAIERASGAPCAVKWLNDIWLNGRKLCGILCELGADWAVLGIGVNVAQSRAEFAAHGLGELATSLAAEGFPVRREALCAAILTELDALARTFPAGLEEALADYRARCLTIGRSVRTGRGVGRAAGVDGGFALLVDHPDGRERVSFGSVELLDPETE